MLTGLKPFEGTQWALAKKIVQDDPVKPSSIVQVPPEIDRVVARALAKEPDHRYQTAGSFAAALKRILEGKPPEDPNEVVHLPPPPAAPPPAPKASQQGTEAEMEFWREVKDSDDPEELELYIEQFPRGVYVELARKKIAELGG